MDDLERQIAGYINQIRPTLADEETARINEITTNQIMELVNTEIERQLTIHGVSQSKLKRIWGILVGLY